jgi:hypothetical protein
MEWGIVMAFPMVLGMLLLIFGQSAEADYQTFGHRVLNPPAVMSVPEELELPKAA